MGNIISKAAPYIFVIGLFCIVIDGLWIVESHNSIVSYPREAFVYLVLGVCLVLISYFLFKFNKPLSIEIQKDREDKKDNRVYIRRIWDERDKLGGRLVVGLFIILVIISIFDFGLAVRLLLPILFCGMVVVAFLYAMYHDDMEMEDEEELKPETARIRKLMSLIDYRKHFFSLSFLLFIIIISSYLLTKGLGYTFAEISGGMNVMTLEGGVYCLAGLLFLCGFVYIIHHVDFLGVRQAKQSYEKVLKIHFLELGFVGLVFCIWLISLVFGKQSL
ncbi:hypothetical protein [Psychrobacillus antarcticus]|uniref:hypothetical protein n=1 Tax=Psychrobacillus antarcticus TaxID=2879115 RepID=UPI0024078D05|nr:hypothetical protein [Psychrobacillus antarcticus]